MKYRIIAISLMLVIFLSGCTSTDKDETESTVDAFSSATLERFRENEVMEYKGARLDPAIGPRDNSIKGIQEVDISTYRLKISGLVNEEKELVYDEVVKLTPYERKITLYCVEGWEATILWKGVLLQELMESAGIKEGANTVIFHAVDGYTTSLPLETIITKQLILAYGSNGLDLPASMGYPFIVVAEDKLGYKWARWVNEIELSNDPSYKGFWEERGYSNEADVK